MIGCPEREREATCIMSSLYLEGRVGLEERGCGGSNEASWGKYMLLSIGIVDGLICLREVCDRLLVVLFHPSPSFHCGENNVLQ